MVPWVGLQCVIVVFPGHAHFLQKPHLNAHADIPSGNRNLNFGLSLHLHPNSVYASRDAKGSGQSMQVYMLV